ncbi:uncharacterized protein [Halyomorpha halys]|uniref:uncharacterized protein isoform X2 n=1 Tax=Halyomorpha halys TaxID=286706 RepID=UPI0006D51BEB|nr:uncharacterized protein LOC106683429 isoform X2 [Halyomorpha halys]
MSSDSLNMLSKVFLIPFLCIISSGLLSAAIMSCGTDGDCPTNHYCYNMTNVCAECVSNFCGRIHRKDSKWKKCHTEPSDCGSCLPGYEEEYFSDGSTRASCILSHHPTPSHYSGYQNSAEVSYPTYLLGFMGFSTVILLGFFMYKTVRRPTVHIIQTEERELRPINASCHNESLNNSDVYEPSAPILPEYSSLDPLRNCGDDGNSEDCCRCKVEVKQPFGCSEYKFEVKQPVNSQLLESAIFRRPDYEEENVDNGTNAQENENDEEDPDSQEEEEANRVNFRIPPVDYHDESTFPSSWTPEPLQAEVENSSLPGPETTKRPSTEMCSSESEDEHSPKRTCNNENEDDEAPSSEQTLFRNFRLAFTRQNQNTNNAQNTAPESPTKDK